MNICFFSHDSNLNGAERSLLDTIDVLKERGVECFVFLPHHGPLCDALIKRNIRISVLPYKRWTGKRVPIWKKCRRLAWNLLMVIPAVIRLRRWRCDIVYTNTSTISIGALAAAALRLPHVWHIREFGYEDHGYTFDFGFNISTRMINRLSAKCVFNSHALSRKYIRRLSPEKIEVVYQGVQVLSKRQNTRSSRSPHMTCIIVGSITESKGQQEAIKAIDTLSKQGLKIKLMIVGGLYTPYAQNLKNYTINCGAGDHIQFVGAVDTAFPLIQSSDVVLVCSRMEAFGRVTVEGMLAAKPVIGARSGGTVELIEDGKTGLFYTPGDVNDLVAKIKYLYNSPKTAEEMGQNGYVRARERFSPEQYGERIHAILSRVQIHHRTSNIQG